MGRDGMCRSAAIGLRSIEVDGMVGQKKSLMNRLLASYTKNYRLPCILCKVSSSRYY